MTPRTEAGKQWLGHSCDDGVEEQREHIGDIEVEAVTAALERLRAVVEGLPTAGRHPTAIKGAVLRAIDEEADR